MMLCPLNVVLKLDRFVNVSCSFNIIGDYFSIPLACCFFTKPIDKYKFTSKTGGFESYDSHQLLLGWLR